MKGTRITHTIGLIIGIVLFVKAPVFAQQEMDFKDMMSTNAINYQNTNVDLYHGLINIHIPIYKFESKTLDVPISLNYSPVDVKGYLIPPLNSNVFPAASNEYTSVYHSGSVGLGWNLNAGGIITRRTKGIPDESDKGNFSNDHLDFDPLKIEYRGLYEPDEDEFTFNFNGLSGSFFFYRGKWKINSEKEFIITPNISNAILYGFTLTMQDGTDFIFGGQNGVEFSNVDKAISTAWYLTSIVTIGGDQINFEYSTPTFYTDFSSLLKKNEYVTHLIQYNNGNRQHSTDYSGTILSSNEASCIIATYLEKISSPTRGFSIVFNYSEFNDRSYPQSLTYVPNVSKKLDNIVIVDGSLSIFRTISFEYFSKSDEELLKLSKIQVSAVSDNGNTVSQPPFQFKYYPKTDLVAPEVLEKIVYPAGGSAVFVFEKHPLPNFSLYTPSNQMTDYNCSEFTFRENYDNCNDVLDMKFRIKKQIIKGSSDELPIVKTYQYDTENQAVQRSRNPVFSHTAIIPTSQVWYELFQKTQYDFVYSDELPSSEERILIGYSSVWEITSNNEDISIATSRSYTHYCYYNYSDYKTVFHARPGLLKSIEKQNAFQVTISNEEYEYEVPNEWLERWSIHSFKCKETSGSESSYGFPVNYQTPYSHYNLKKIATTNDNVYRQTSYNYYPTTNNISQVIVTDFDPNNIDLTPLDSTTTSFTYLDKFYNAQTGGNGQNLLDDNHWLNNLPIETVVRKNGKVISGQFITLKAMESPNPDYILRYRKPYQIFQLSTTAPIEDYSMGTYNWGKDSRYKLVKTFDKYDMNENLLQYHNEGESPVSIIYDEMGLPLIEIKGVEYDIVKARIDSDHLSPKVIGDVNRLRTIYPDALITSYVFNPKFGVSAITAPNGTTTYREYDPFGRLKCIRDQNQNILQSKNFYYYNHE